MTTRRVKLASPRGSTTSVFIADDGSLVVEWYDYGDEAQSHFGNDVAFLLKVAAEHKPGLLAALGGSAAADAGNSEAMDDALLSALERRFGSYSEVKAWFESAGIAYTSAFDAWA